MKKKLLVALAVLIGIVLVVLAIGATRPAEFRVERSVVIEAPPSAVYAVITDFKRFGEWSPWAKLDPQLKSTMSGAPSGKGAVYDWQGNDDVGKGRMTIEDTVENQRVDVQVEFFEPWAAKNHVVWTLNGAQTPTTMTWVMEGRHESVLEKTMCMFMDMDRLIGKDFEEGLASLKRVVEKK